MKKLLLLSLALLLLYSCGGDDDICDSGEGTPRMKVKFRNASNQEVRLDSLYFTVDYGTDVVAFPGQANVDSLLVPLRVDDHPYTDLYFKTSKVGDSTKVQVSYIRNPQYVSASCGVKILYKDVNATLLHNADVQHVVIAQNTIENEENTHLFLVY